MSTDAVEQACYTARMIQVLKAPVSVSLFFDHKARTVRLKRVIFDGTEYHLKKVGYHMPHREGRTLYHLF